VAERARESSRGRCRAAAHGGVARHGARRGGGTCAGAGSSNGRRGTAAAAVWRGAAHGWAMRCEARRRHVRQHGEQQQLGEAAAGDFFSYFI
jgi:hypothetical protein